MSNIQRPTSSICFIDTHAHLDSYSEIDKVIEKASKAGVKKIIVVSFDLHCAKFNQDVVSKYENLFSAVGVHPHNAKDLDKDSREELTKLAKSSKVRAIGEPGLDFHYLYSEKAQQEEAFRWHIKLANELSLPLIIHSREATEEVFKILDKEGWSKDGLVFHAFSGNF
ncbi:MAG: TatD family deoxyribonuclease, partial [Actinobacteria bacterium]